MQMPTPCQHSERLWNALFKDMKAYKELLEQQFTTIKERSLEFRQFEEEIMRARRHLGTAKTAVINHHRTHRCHVRKNLDSPNAAK